MKNDKELVHPIGINMDIDSEYGVFFFFILYSLYFICHLKIIHNRSMNQ